MPTNRLSDTRPAAPRLPAILLGALLGAAAGIGCVAVPVPSGGGAGTGERDGPGDVALAGRSVEEAVRDLPKARRGNMREYTVRGHRYRTLDSAAGFRERGTASWYGAKFHGRPTSSGEPFDMHALTAAHRRLPLPTFVRVTNVANGAAVVVKVNDRGPFVDDRVIDLSYAAALRLGMLEHGTAEVELEALSTHLPPAGTADEAAARDTAVARAPATRSSRVIQLGAFAEEANAKSLARRVEPHLSAPARVEHDAGRALFRVRIGPISDVAALEASLAALASAGVVDYDVVPGEGATDAPAR